MYQITRKYLTEWAFNEHLYYLGYNSSSFKKKAPEYTNWKEVHFSLWGVQSWTIQDWQVCFTPESFRHLGSWYLMDPHSFGCDSARLKPLSLYICSWVNKKQENIGRLWKVLSFLKSNLKNCIYNFCLFPIALNLTMLQLIATRKADKW